MFAKKEKTLSGKDLSIFSNTTASWHIPSSHSFYAAEARDPKINISSLALLRILNFSFLISLLKTVTSIKLRGLVNSWKLSSLFQETRSRITDHPGWSFVLSNQGTFRTLQSSSGFY
jgi:hypothetical protein